MMPDPAPGRITREPPAPEQAALVAYLGSPAAHAGETPRRIDTHLSHVFLTRDEVFKLKRAKRLDFVDYSTPELRHHYCERELASNRAWAADLYVGVKPVFRAGEGFRIGGEEEAGDAADWLVHMRRFADTDRLDRRLAAGAVREDDLLAFADALAAQHGDAPADPRAGGAQRMAGLIDQVAGDLLAAARDPGLRRNAEQWRTAAGQAVQEAAPVFDARARAGFVRRCHGDLHLKNICRWKGRLIGYDALEFDEAMSTIDVLYDTAFTVMDFWHHGAGRFASLLLNRYLCRTGDYAGLAIFDVCLSLRAGVRAMAAAMGGDETGAAAYLDLADVALAPRPPPALIAVGGRSGSGKSTLAARLAPGLAPLPGAIVLRSDVVRKTLHGAQPETPLDAAAYAGQVSADVYDTLAAEARAVLAAGYPCILDATFLGEDGRRRFDRLAETAPGPVHRLWLTAPAETLRARLLARGRDASDADLAVLDRQLTEADPAGWQPVDVSGTLEDAAERLRTALTQTSARSFTEHRFNPAHDV